MSSAIKLPRRRSIAIVADGPSAAMLITITLPQEIYCIGINHASIWLPRCDAYMTACADHRQRWVMNNQRQGVRYFAAVSMEYGSRIAKEPGKSPREKNVTFFREFSGSMSDDPRYCSVGIEGYPRNSVYAGLNLALHLKAERVAIFGLDCSARPRVSGGIAGDMKHLPALFERYDGSAKVINASPGSPVSAFPICSPSEAIAWLL